jgi:dihydropteroate synthase
MGIVNVTPDSFADGGRYFDPEAALTHALALEAAGADLIDIGAESTRPGFTPLTVAEEWRRLGPALAQIRREVRVPLSIDTCHAEVALRALAAGVEIVNDVSGGTRDPDMFAAVAQSGAPYVLMHSGTLRRTQAVDGLPVEQAVARDLEQALAAAVAHGVREEAVIVDPGIGFGKTQAENLRLVAGLDALRALGRPILIGTSRKSFVGHVLGLPVSERLEGTAATVAIAVARGADIVRVHDVQEMVRVVRMTDALVR